MGFLLKNVLSEFHQYRSQMTFSHLTVILKLTGIQKSIQHLHNLLLCVSASQHACPCMCRRSSKSAESLGGCGTPLFKGCLHGDRCGSSPWRWIGAYAGRQGRGTRTRQEWWSHPDRKSKRSTSRVGSWWKKVQFHKPNYFWDGGEKNITAITAPGVWGWGSSGRRQR